MCQRNLFFKYERIGNGYECDQTSDSDDGNCGSPVSIHLIILIRHKFNCVRGYFFLKDKQHIAILKNIWEIYAKEFFSIKLKGESDNECEIFQA
jgi:hypothetical protein